MLQGSVGKVLETHEIKTYKKFFVQMFLSQGRKNERS